MKKISKKSAIDLARIATLLSITIALFKLYGTALLKLDEVNDRLDKNQAEIAMQQIKLDKQSSEIACLKQKNKGVHCNG